ncbi:RDD family protein [Streptomyces sp. NPDC050738]|uniref:RDD family protein n=1 Tax=Streptomyces sp. NPDC050738 TaxID=3154744 RepID=UPI00341BAA2E
MSAPTPATGDGSPTPGYYPDPSIPGYVRFWNGGSWVPGTSRPAPTDGEAPPAAPTGTSAPAAAPAPAPAPAVPPAEETGPMFLDEEPEYDSRQEPASAWQADTARQTGFGGERDQRVSWGGPVPSQAPAQDPRGAAQTPAQQQAAQQQAAALPASPTPAALPPVRQPASEGTALIRRVQRPEPEPAQSPEPEPDRTTAIRAVRPRGASAATNRTDGTMAIRSLPQGQAPSAPQQPAPAQAQPAPLPVPPQPQQPHPEALNSPTTPGPGGGAASWAQQVHQLAQPDVQQQAPQQPGPQQAGAQQGGSQQAAPWKPPTLDPFAQLAQAQSNARPGGLGKRLAARLIDTLVLGAAVGAIAAPFVTKATDHINAKIDEAKLSGQTVTVWLLDGTTATYLGIVLGAFLVLGVLYEAVPTGKWGRTLGKKLCGLDVRGIESHEPPGFAAALRRWLVYGVLGLIAIGVLNVLWCLFDRPWRQCWHDKAAGTFVAAS